MAHLQPDGTAPGMKTNTYDRYAKERQGLGMIYCVCFLRLVRTAPSCLQYEVLYLNRLISLSLSLVSNVSMRRRREITGDKSPERSVILQISAALPHTAGDTSHR